MLVPNKCYICWMKLDELAWVLCRTHAAVGGHAAADQCDAGANGQNIVWQSNWGKRSQTSTVHRSTFAMRTAWRVIRGHRLICHSRRSSMDAMSSIKWVLDFGILCFARDKFSFKNEYEKKKKWKEINQKTKIKTVDTWGLRHECARKNSDCRTDWNWMYNLCVVYDVFDMLTAALAQYTTHRSALLERKNPETETHDALSCTQPICKHPMNFFID